MSNVSVITFGVEGNVRRDDFGRVVLDQCESDQDHLRFAPSDLEAGRPKCRSLLEEHFAGLLGRRGVLFVSAVFVDEIDEKELERRYAPLVETNREILQAFEERKKATEAIALLSELYDRALRRDDDWFVELGKSDRKRIDALLGPKPPKAADGT